MKSIFSPLGIMFALLVAGCGPNDSDSESDTDGALLLGTVEQGEGARDAPEFGSVIVTVNSSVAQTEVAENLDFAVRQMPTGDVRIGVAIDGIRGTLDLEDVEPGEVIEVRIRAAQGSLSISVVRRSPPAEAPIVEVEPIHRGDPIVIRGHHTVHRFAPGVYLGDVIVEGHHITLVGAPNPDCDPTGGTVLEGALRLDGHHIRVVGLNLQGPIDVAAKSHHLSMTTSACFDHGWEAHEGFHDDDDDYDDDDDHDDNDDDDDDDGKHKD